MFDKNKFKKYGLGLGLRKDIRKETLKHIQEKRDQSLVKWLEIVPENYIYRGGLAERNFAEVLDMGMPLIPHGVNLSVGTAPEQAGKASFDRHLIEGLKKLFTRINPPWFSDHISCTRINGIYMQDLIPLPRTKEAVEIVSTNIKFLQDEFQLPFLIENPSYYATFIEPELGEADFINQILDKADCGMLLDVNNIYVNAHNHKYDALEFLDQIDLERVVQIHIAGHQENYKSWISGKHLGILDTHGHPIRKEVYKILDQVLKRTNINAVLLERDSNFPDFQDLLDELREINSIMEANQKLIKA